MHHLFLILLQPLEYILALEILYRQQSRVERYSNLVKDVGDEALLAVPCSALHDLCGLRGSVLDLELLPKCKHLAVGTFFHKGRHDDECLEERDCVSANKLAGLWVVA